MVAQRESEESVLRNGIKKLAEEANEVKKLKKGRGQRIQK